MMSVDHSHSTNAVHRQADMDLSIKRPDYRRKGNLELKCSRFIQRSGNIRGEGSLAWNLVKGSYPSSSSRDVMVTIEPLLDYGPTVGPIIFHSLHDDNNHKRTGVKDLTIAPQNKRQLKRIREVFAESEEQPITRRDHELSYIVPMGVYSSHLS